MSSGGSTEVVITTTTIERTGATGAERTGGVEEEVVTVFDSRHKVVDLGYELNATTIFWPGGEGFNLCMHTCGSSPPLLPPSSYSSLPSSSSSYSDGSSESDFYAAGTFSCAEHGGTHIDAPFHFYQHGISVEKLKLKDLIVPCRVIEIIDSPNFNSNANTNANANANINSNDSITSRNAEVQDILDHERVHGALPEGCAVLFNFNWAKHYLSGPAAYLGFDERVHGKYNADTSMLLFPGVSPDASSLLVTRKVAAVGLDTASLDPGPCKTFLSHRILLESGIYGIENINGNISALPAKGATLMVMPMKITGGSGAPARVVAFLPPII